MPVYEYACPKCSHTEEFLHLKPAGSADLDKEARELHCPECDVRLERVPSAPGRPVIR